MGIISERDSLGRIVSAGISRVIVDGRVRCPRCEQWIEMHTYRRSKSSRLGVQGYCRRCQQDATNESVKRRRHSIAARLKAIKLERGCTDCGYATHAEALDFDHLPGATKLFAVGAPGNYGWPMILAEIAKCEVVCANCHRHRTYIRAYGET